MEELQKEIDVMLVEAEDSENPQDTESLSTDMQSWVQCVCRISSLLGSLIAFQFFIRSSHWQCQGSRFYEFHLMFDKMYNSLEEVIDELAELAVREGKDVPLDISQVSKTSLLSLPADYTHDELIQAIYYMACDIETLLEWDAETRSQNAVLDNVALVISKIKYLTSSAI